MAVQNNATIKMVKNILDGTTPPQKVVGSYEQLEDGTYNLIIRLTGDAPSAAAITQINGEDLAGKEFYDYVRTEGAVLFSFNPDFSPAARYGGSWENITDRFLIGAGGSYALDSTGGEAIHDHLYGVRKQSWNNVVTGSSNQSICVKEYRDSSFPASNSIGSTNDYTNGALTTNTPLSLVDLGYSEGHTGQAETMPPYIACNIWRKIS